MPLSTPHSREHIHTRSIECRGFRRSDGLWDIEAHLTDVKTYAFANHDRGHIEAGEPIHDMWLRVTVDDDLLIRDIEACTVQAPYNVCPEIAANYRSLIGTRIQPGWRRRINERVGGVHGCTHLRELLAPIATTAFQTIAPLKFRERGQYSIKRAPLLIGSCHAYAPTSPVVARLWPGHDVEESS